MENIIYDDTHEHDKEFMIERINKLIEYLAIEKNKSFMFESQNAHLQDKINRLETEIIILKSK
jgi:hypothetical protein